MTASYAQDVFLRIFGRAPAPRRESKPASTTPEDKLSDPPLPDTQGHVIYHVTPRAHDGRWNIKVRGTEDPVAVIDVKDDAIEQAKQLARRHDWSQVIVHNQDGKIAHEFAYGSNPEDDDAPEETESDDRFVDDYEGDDTEDESAFAAPDGERVVYHVTPRKKDGRWNVRRRGAERPSHVADTKEIAIDKAREFADRRSWAQVIIHNQDGRIAEEYVYGGPERRTERPTGKVSRRTGAVSKPTARVVYHVTPRAEDGRWNVIRQGGDKPTRVLDTKDAAVDAARDLAKNQQRGQIVIHNQDGKIAEEFKYGE